MRFSLRTMTSGARNSVNFFRRLLRLMTRRYRSFRSEVANRPPSSGTSGRSSGGITGTTSRIIQSRSEEHTSELQSLAYLVCRLLLEKKKKIQICCREMLTYDVQHPTDPRKTLT